MKIKIKNLRAKTLIGVYDSERTAQRDLIFNIKLTYNSEKAAANDDINEAIDYAAISQLVREICAASTYQLLESLAKKISDEIYKKFPKTEKLKIEIDKENIIPDCDSVSVTFKS